MPSNTVSTPFAYTKSRTGLWAGKLDVPCRCSLHSSLFTFPTCKTAQGSHYYRLARGNVHCSADGTRHQGKNHHGMSPVVSAHDLA